MLAPTRATLSRREEATVAVDWEHCIHSVLKGESLTVQKNKILEAYIYAQP